VDETEVCFQWFLAKIGWLKYIKGVSFLFPLYIIRTLQMYNNIESLTYSYVSIYYTNVFFGFPVIIPNLNIYT